MGARPKSRMSGRLLLLAAIFFGASAGLGAKGVIDNISFRVSPGILFNLGGSYTDVRNFRDVVDLGGGLNIGLRYEINKNIYFEAAYGYTIQPVKNGQQPFEFRHESSYFDMSAVTFNAVLYLKSGYAIEPFLTLGGGVYPWVFRSGWFGGDVWPAPAKPQTTLRDTDFGLNVGLGVEANVLLNLTAIFEVRYSYIYSRDIPRFATDDFTQIDFLGFSLGVIYYFKRK